MITQNAAVLHNNETEVLMSSWDQVHVVIIIVSVCRLYNVHESAMI